MPSDLASLIEKLRGIARDIDEEAQSWSRPTYRADTIREAADALEAQRHLLPVVQKAYRKHHLEDDSIGWDELADDLHDALCEAMGDKGYQRWVKGVRP